MITTLLLSKLNSEFRRAGVLKVLCLLLVNLVFAFSVKGQTIDEAPNGNPDDPTVDPFIERFPLSNFRPYEASASLYLGGTELTTSGNITTVGFFLETTNGVVPALPVKIYLKQTTATTLSSNTFSSEVTGATLVFDGTVTAPTLGNAPGTTGAWVDITLNQNLPYNYVATNNLEVLVEVNCTTCSGSVGLDPGSDTRQFRFSNQASRFMWTDFDAATTMNIFSRRPNARFTITPTSTPTCATPTDLAVTSITSSSGTLTFTNNTGSEPGSYVVKIGAPGFDFTNSGTVVTGPPYTASGLNPSTTYEFAVQKNCTNGASGLIEREQFTTSAAPVVCDAPTSVSGTGTGQTTAQVTFSGGTATSAYIIEYGPTSTFPSGTSTANASGSPANLTGLTPGTAYTFVVRTNCGNGNISNNSPQGTFTTTAAPLTCAAPTTVGGTGTGQTTAQITFSGGDAGTNYVIEYGPTSTFPAGTATATVSGSPANLGGLTAGTAYTFVVRTNCPNGATSGNSPQGTFNTNAAPLTCAAPTTVGGTGTGQNTAQITFSGGDAGTSYTIQYGPSSTYPAGSTTANVAGSPANLTGLTAGTQYTFVVRTNCSNGATSTDSPQGTFTTTATPLTCAAPTTVGGTGTGQTTAQITFSGGDAGTNYVIEYGPTSTFPAGTATATVSGSPANLGGLTAGTAYTFVVRTNCPNGATSGNSPQGTFNTNAAPLTCAAPTTVGGTGTGQNTAQITFSGGDAGTSYTVQYGPSSTYPAGSTTANVAGSPANLTGLTAGTQYTFVVRTNCANGLTSTDSPQGTFSTTAAPVACDAPTSVSGTGTGQTTAQVTFSGGTATGAYIIEYGPTSTFPSGTTTANATGSPANLTSLTPGTAYTFVVRTNCGNGNISNNSPQGTFTTTAAPLTCAAPTTVGGTGTGQTTAQITFSGGDAGTSYTIQYGPSSTYPAGSTTANVAGSPANLTGLTAGTQYTFVVRTNCSNGATSTDSPQGTFTTTVTPPVCLTGTWLGTTSSDWHTAANWCNGVIPTSTTDVRIPAGSPNFPIVTLAAETHDLLIEPGATLTLTSGTLTISGLYTNLGTLIDNGNGSLAFTGPLPQTIGKPGNILTFFDLTIGPGGALQAGPVRVRRVLTLNGNLTTAGNELTLLADNAVQSMVVNNGAAQVNGIATMEKYINPGNNPSFGYRHLTSPVAGATIAQLNDDTPLIVNPAYNTNPTPGTTTPFPTIYRYNEARLDLPFLTTPNFDSGWESPIDLTEVMPPAVGYTVNMLPVEIDFTGILNNGNYTRTLTRGNQPRSGYNFLGNPYPSPLNWDLVNLPAGVDQAAYVTRSTGRYTGTYVAYVNGIPANGEYIAAMQGFFIRATVPTTSITFQNDDRVTTYENPALYKKVETRPVVTLALRDATGVEDKTYVYFENGATANFDGFYDAFKLPNSGPIPSIFSRAGNDQLAINGLPVSSANTIVPLGGRVPQAGTWSLTADQIINFLPNQTIYLEDIATNTLHNLSLQNSYTFTTTQTDLNGRFFLRFGPGTTTGITAADLAAKVTVYPNPNNGEFTISMPALNAPVVKAAIFNAVGQQVWQKALPTNGVYLKETVNTKELAPGIYTLRLETNAGPVQRKIIIE